MAVPRPPKPLPAMATRTCSATCAGFGSTTVSPCARVWYQRVPRTMVLSGTRMQGPGSTKIDGRAEEQAEERAQSPDIHRLRLLEGFSRAVSERGYASTTIAH